MPFKAVFIGVNKHEDPAIPELTGAVRDAQALHALFQDTFEDIEAHLLVDSSATNGAIRERIDRVLLDSSDEDVVVISFSGHGTEGHQLVAYDTSQEEPGSTSLGMHELADKFKASSARAILCIIDCCFSGAAPARVLTETPRPRTVITDYASFEGKGRFLLAASMPTQPAWEERGGGHGLLTRAVIEVLSSGDQANDITIAIAEIIALTRRYAQAIGEQQDPCFVGGTDGQLMLPVLRKGVIWKSIFPNLEDVHIGKEIGELSQFGFPTEVISAWESRYPAGLNTLQLEAINNYRVLNGGSLLTIAPTSAGKTFIGEMAAVCAAVGNRKTVFLLPYRALVNEKYEDFSATYRPSGIRVIRCAGDFTDEVGLFISGRYDIAFLTYEMFLSLCVGTPQVLKPLGLIVLDEAQFITDPTRGITVELLFTLILSGKTQGVCPQIIALSAVIGDSNDFDVWLGARKFLWTERPVPLIEGVLDRQGIFQHIDQEGIEREIQLIPSHAIRQRKQKPSSQDVIVPLVQSLVSAKEKILIFRNTRGPAEGCAAYLAKDLALPAAKEALAALSLHDISTSGLRLRECLEGGTAFHNSNLNRDERLVVEHNFRGPIGGIEALVATTTLAAGINTPASTVILAEQEFIGDDGRPFTIAEYKNMAGRAGRLGYNETGKAILLADTPFQRRELFNRYTKGVPESIKSSFANHDVRTWVIRLLSQVNAITKDNIPQLLASTYGGFLSIKTDPAWGSNMQSNIQEIVGSFIELGLLEEDGDKVQLSLLGRACGQSNMAFESSMRLIETLKAIPQEEVSAFHLIGLLQILPEADRQYTPVRKKARTESSRIAEATARYGRAVVESLRRLAGEEMVFWARCKRAAILADYASGVPIQELEKRYSVPFGGQVQAGDILRFADATRFHMRSAHQILSALLVMGMEQERQFDEVMRQLEFGVPHDLAWLMERPFLLSRGETLALAEQGIRSHDDLVQMSSDTAKRVLGEDRHLYVSKILNGE